MNGINIKGRILREEEFEKTLAKWNFEKFNYLSGKLKSMDF
jgi:hypothetical protein